MIRLVLTLAAARGPRALDMVPVQTVCPEIRVELRYATPRNGAHRAIYPVRARCLLRRAVAERLCRVQQRLAEARLGLKIWDAYRPLSAQRALWLACPDRRFVAPPGRGSKHSRGAAVDVTLVDGHGREGGMPCDFDTFSARARPTFRGGTAEQRRNRSILQQAMQAEGFVPNRSEWWHFDAPDWKDYPLLDLSLSSSSPTHRPPR